MVGLSGWVYGHNHDTLTFASTCDTTYIHYDALSGTRAHATLEELHTWRPECRMGLGARGGAIAVVQRVVVERVVVANGEV